MSKPKREYYELHPQILEENLSFDYIDSILDKLIDNEFLSEKEEEDFVTYVMQLIYRSGNKITDSDVICEKMENLVTDRRIDLMKDAGLIEEFSSTETYEPCYVFTDKVL